MRTDVKVGLVIAIVLVLVGVWFFVVRSRGTTEPVGEPEAKLTEPRPPGPSNVVRTEPGRFPRPRPTGMEPTTQPTGEEAATTQPAGTVTIGFAPARRTDPILAVRTEPRTEAPARRTTDWWPSVPSRITPGRPPEPVTPAGPAAVRTQRPGVYTVKEGDTYWSIAKAQYGKASLYKLLEEANANIPARSLRPKMTIRIPPPPSQPVEVARPSAPSPDHGVARTDESTGKRYYVVKKGDNGFWGISIAVFNTPKRWKEIESVNPGVNSGALKPGQKVWLPTGAVETAAGPLARVERPMPALRATARAPSSWSGTGAPRRTSLPDGRVFD